MLRVVRNFFQDPVSPLFKVLDRRHRLLHVWDLSGYRKRVKLDSPVIPKAGNVQRVSLSHWMERRYLQTSGPDRE